MRSVDVLAVLRRVSSSIPNEDFIDFDDAFAAVAELIEAVKALPTPRGAQVITFEGADYVLLAPEDHEALCNALARVTGAQP